jgi:hypothetical protein
MRYTGLTGDSPLRRNRDACGSPGRRALARERFGPYDFEQPDTAGGEKLRWAGFRGGSAGTGAGA